MPARRPVIGTGLLVTGHETTVSQTGNSVLALLTHPGQLAAVRSDPEKTGRAGEELLEGTSDSVALTGGG